MIERTVGDAVILEGLPAPIVEPSFGSVSLAMQFLYAAGVLDGVPAAIEAMPDPETAQAAWDFFLEANP